jgi:hypothetical protein
MRLAALAILTVLTASPLLAQPCSTVPPNIQPNSSTLNTQTYTELAHGFMLATHPQDIPKMAPLDSEFILHCGSPQEAARVWAVFKDRPVTFLDTAVVIAASADEIAVAIDDEAKRTHKADYILRPADQFTSIPPVGSVVEISGTYKSYVSEPILITLNNVIVTPVSSGTSKHRRQNPASPPPQK